MSDSFLTISEIRKITGTSKPYEQVRALSRMGIEPFVCPKTGRPIVFREVAIDAQKRKGDTPVEMDLEALSG